MIDEIVDARREPVGLDLHRRELRAQRLETLAEGLAQMIEARGLEVRGGVRHCGPAKAERNRRCAEVEQRSTTSSIALKPAPSSVSWKLGSISQSSRIIGADAFARIPRPSPWTRHRQSGRAAFDKV